MNVQKAFEKFLANLRIADTTTISGRYKSITKLLNRRVAHGGFGHTGPSSANAKESVS